MPDQIWFKTRGTRSSLQAGSRSIWIALSVVAVDSNKRARRTADCIKLAIEYVDFVLQRPFQISTNNPGFKLEPIEKPAPEMLTKLQVPIFHDVTSYELRD